MSMSTLRIAIAIVAAVMLCLLGAMALRGKTSSSNGQLGATSGSSGRAVELPMGTMHAADADRTPVAFDLVEASNSQTSSAPATAPSKVPVAEARVSGTVMDVMGRRRSNIGLATSQSPWEEISRSRQDGTFQAVVPPGACILALEQGLSTVFQHCAKGLAYDDAVVVIADEVGLSGRVVDRKGNAASGARIWLSYRPDPALSSLIVLDNASLVMASAISGQDGTFKLPAVPTGPGLFVQAHATQSGSAELLVPARSTSDMLIVLDPGSALRREVVGTVLFPDGTPASGAEVRLGESNSTVASEDGRFRLTLLSDYAEASLIAFHRGYQAAVVPGFGAELESSVASREVRLVLGPEALTIEGRVLEVNGLPMAGWRVELASGVEATLHQIPPVFLESLVDTGEPGSVTDAQGQFRIGGLSSQDYIVRAVDPKSLVTVESEPIRAGERSAVIRVPSDRTWPEIRGRVTAVDGAPVHGVKVALQVAKSTSVGISAVDREFVMSGVGGEFVFRDVPRMDLQLSCSGDSICAQAFKISSTDDPLELGLCVQRKVHFRLNLRSAEAQACALVVALQRDNQLSVLHAPGGYGGPGVPREMLQESTTLTTGELAKYVVLYDGDGLELRRVEMNCAVGLTCDIDV